MSKATVYKDYKIISVSQGFSEPVLFRQGEVAEMYQIAIYTVIKDDILPNSFMFAFNIIEAAMYNSFYPDNADHKTLLNECVKTIKEQIDSGELDYRKEYCYEYVFDGAPAWFELVKNPLWQSPNYL